ncbi:MAG: hypothetical protein AUG51_02350 [Acidobacteria bacterium 13_1_20CM_3_53_8]|nr:MAG: hypothetical protein AUG51_02350 [Acidobacteria bacterium 13_1_20CM_3_53_8]
MKKKLAMAFVTIGFLIFLTSSGHLTTAAQGRQVRRRSAQAVADRWYMFTSPDRDFTLDFPREPKREQDGQGPVTLIRNYALNTRDGMRFSVNFQDIGGDPRSSQNNEFAPDHEELVAAAARKDGRRVVQIHRLAKNVVEMELWQTVGETKADINYLERDVIWRGRVYTLGCGSLVDGRGVDKSICRRFFNSLRFTR